MNHAHEIDIHHALKQRGVGFPERRGFRAARRWRSGCRSAAGCGFRDRGADRGLIGDVGNPGEMRRAGGNGLVQRRAVPADTVTVAPARARAEAIARPMPRPPPVTSACGECGNPDMRSPRMDFATSIYFKLQAFARNAAAPVMLLRRPNRDCFKHELAHRSEAC